MSTFIETVVNHDKKDYINKRRFLVCDNCYWCLSYLPDLENDPIEYVIKNSTLAESKFLNSIRMSATEREKTLFKDMLYKAQKQKEAIKKDIGIETSISEDDIIEYTKELKDNDTK